MIQTPIKEKAPHLLSGSFLAVSAASRSLPGSRVLNFRGNVLGKSPTVLSRRKTVVQLYKFCKTNIITNTVLVQQPVAGYHNRPGFTKLIIFYTVHRRLMPHKQNIRYNQILWCSVCKFPLKLLERIL